MVQYFTAPGVFNTSQPIASTLSIGTAPVTVASTAPVANQTAQYHSPRKDGRNNTKRARAGRTVFSEESRICKQTVYGAASTTNVRVTPRLAFCASPETVKV